MKKYKDYIILLIITMGLQAVVYYLVKAFEVNFYVMETMVELPFIKQFVYFYDIWYPFIILNTFLIYKFNRKDFKYLITVMLLAGLLSHITFIIYPTMVLRPEINIKGLSDLVLYITYKLDTPAVNCLPSMHCVYCFATSFFILRSKEIKPKYRTLIVTISMLIVLSTMFIRQHIIEDALLALVYTAFVATIVLVNSGLVDKVYHKFYKLIKYDESTNN